VVARQAINDPVNSNRSRTTTTNHLKTRTKKERASMRNGVTTALMVGVVIAGATLVMAADAGAQQPGSPAQKKACRPDVFRLCAAEIPNVQAIVRCLRANESRLSPDCRAVFAGELR
jgi:hypothetical protein